jgi:hypothetical protein
MSFLGARNRRWLTSLVVALVVVVALAGLENVAIGSFLPHFPRMTTDFSASYLQRELSSVATQPPQTVFLGDSVLWGYRLEPRQTAIGLLRSHGCACLNLAFKSGSPPNYYGLVRLLRRFNVHPHLVVLEINQRVFNPGDKSYKSLHPAIAQLAWPLYTAQERAQLSFASPPPAVPGLERAISSLSVLYAMRSDIRESLYGDTDSKPAKQDPPFRPSDFEGTYDLTQLDGTNVGVEFLTKTVTQLQEARIPTVAFMTPTNHALLHDYIDSPEYRSNGAYLRRLLEQHGVKVLDLDATFAQDEFIDNDHLTEEGNRRLASFLGVLIGR